MRAHLGGARLARFPALVIAVHGTADPAGRAVLSEFVAGVATLLPGVRVVPAYVSNQRPSVTQALQTLHDEGVTRAVVLPLLLTAATHSKTDVAGAVAAARLALPHLRISYGRPLGPHRALLAALDDRLAAAGARPGDDTAVVLAAAGASDADSNADVAKVARLFWEGREWYAVEPAFASATRPGVAEAIGRLRLLGARRVVVAPYFLAPGHLSARVVRQAFAAGADLVADVLGAHPAVLRLVVERYREAISGDVRANCDTCPQAAVAP